LISIVQICLICHTISELNINNKNVVTPVDNMWDYHTEKVNKMLNK